MATYDELYALMYSNDGVAIQKKVRTAITIAADKVAESTDTAAPFSQEAGAHDSRKAWVLGEGAFHPAKDLVQKIWNAILAKNKGASLAVILGSTDATIQTNVETLVDIFAGN